MDLSVVIVSYNTRDITRRCLEAVAQRTSGLEYEIIVVDNASTDGSPAMIETEFPSVRLIRNSENRGFAAAQNAGLCLARGRNVLILNSDVLLLGNAARTMVEYLRGGPADLGAVGPRILNPDGTVAPSARRAILSKPMVALGIINRHFNVKRWLPESFMRRYLGFLLGRWHDNYAAHDTVRQVEYVDGMCTMVKREVLEETGLFDEQFFLDFEIIDLSNRIRARGWRIEFFPSAEVVHLAHSTRRQVSRAIVETHRSELIYYARSAPAYVPFVKRLAVCVVIVKALCVKAASLLSGSGESPRQELLSLYGQIIALCRQFDAGRVRNSERIPRLQTGSRREEGSPERLPDGTSRVGAL